MMHFSSSLSTHESTLGGLRRSVEQLVADGTKCRAENNSLVRFYLLMDSCANPCVVHPTNPNPPPPAQRSELETAVQKLRSTRDMLANEQCVRPNLRLER